jgi:hypothetical protein
VLVFYEENPRLVEETALPQLPWMCKGAKSAVMAEIDYDESKVFIFLLSAVSSLDCGLFFLVWSNHRCGRSLVDNSLFKFYTRTYCERALAGKEFWNLKIPIVAERNKPGSFSPPGILQESMPFSLSNVSSG